MADYKATPEQWAMLEEFSASEYDTTILELRTRVEALEVKYETQRLATLEWGKDVDKLKRWSDQHLQRIMKLEAQHQDKLDRLIEMDHADPAPASSLIERVQRILGHSYPYDARAAIRVIADEVERRGDKGLDLDPGETADWLRREADTVIKED
jgi:hypothetical protein